MKNKSVVISRMAGLALMTGLLAAPAYAGFEWSPPPAAPVISATDTDAPLVPAAPAEGVDKSELMPIPGAQTSAPAEALPAEPTTPQIEKESTALPVSRVTENLAPPAPAGPFAEAVGFGSDIPLALALGQIVPAEYAYSFASNVNPGLKISWNGGKPWNEVLNEALQPHDLRADVVGTAVIVRSGATAKTNPMAEPIVEETSESTPTPAGAEPLSASSVDTPAKGEGTANNYPRRTPPKGFFGSVFTPDHAKGNQAPRPPEDKAVLIENEVSPEEMVEPAAPAAEKAASLAPAAPAVAAPLPVEPTPLRPQKISYADESVRDSSDSVLQDRPVTQNASIETKGPVLDPFQVSFWQADSNRNLREVLTEWAEKAGVEVIWDSGYDYKLPTSLSLHGTFPEAVTKVFGLYGTTEPRPQGKLHPNLPKGPSVLLVENYP